jgi:hypothetical protein
MSRIAMPMTGGCICGDVRFAIESAPLIAHACHCRDCQKHTGSVFSLGLVLHATSFNVTRGTAVPGFSKGINQHHFCPECHCWLWSIPGNSPDMIALRATFLDDPSWFVPMMEVNTVERLPWSGTLARFSYERMPDPADYSNLVKAFSDWLMADTPPRTA